MEVIYTGLRQTPEQIVSAALQEDADVIGLSILSGAHSHIAPKLMNLLKAKGLDDVLVVIGGIIPDVDIPELKEIGVKGVFPPGTPMQEIIDFISTNARRARLADLMKLEPIRVGSFSRYNQGAAYSTPRRRQRDDPARDRADVCRRGRPGRHGERWRAGDRRHGPVAA